jgi:AraC family transcriptional regulator
MCNLQNSITSFPFLRFSLRYCMAPKEVNGPRISYIQSVYLIEEGEGKIYYETDAVDLFTGVHIYLPSGKIHTIVSGDKKPIIFRCVFFEWNYSFRPGVIYRNDYLPELCKPINNDYIEPLLPLRLSEYNLLDDTKEWNYFFNSISSNVDIYNTSHFPDSLRIQGKFQLFLDYILSIIMQTKVIKDHRIEKMIKQMENENDSLMEGNIERWAESMGFSRSYFHYLFKLQTGFTPNLFRNTIRIKSTISEIINTNKTITKIAEDHCFESVHSYTKLFRKIMGETPGEFRRRYRIYHQ